MEQPKPGEIWEIKYFQRTYWAKTTAEIIDFRPGWGWLFRPIYCTSTTMCRKKVRFIKCIIVDSRDR